MKIGERITPTGILIFNGEPYSEEWLQTRTHGIGGSDIPSIAGMSKWQSATELYRLKRIEVVPEKPYYVQQAAEFGKELEEVIARRLMRERDVVVSRGIGTLQHIEDEWRICNVDGLVSDFFDQADRYSAIFEAKTRSQYQLDEWPFDGNPPEDVLCQVQWNLGVTGFDKAYVAALIGGQTFRSYVVNRDDELLKMLIDMARDFWIRVQEGTPPMPDGSDASTELYNHIWNVEEGKTYELSPRELQLMQRRRFLIAEIADKEAEVKLIANTLRASMEDAEIASSQGSQIATWRKNGNFASRRFQEKEPDIAELCVSPQFDISKVKELYPEKYNEYRARVLRINDKRIP